MKGADDEVLRGARAYQRLGALAHFLRRLVGEGDGRDLAGLISGLQQPGDLVRDHPRLARTGAGKDEARTAEVMNRFELSWIERVWSGGQGDRRELT